MNLLDKFPLLLSRTFVQRFKLYIQIFKLRPLEFLKKLSPSPSYRFPCSQLAAPSELRTHPRTTRRAPLFLSNTTITTCTKKQQKAGIPLLWSLGCIGSRGFLIILLALLCPISRQNFIVKSSKFLVLRKTPDRQLIVKAPIFPLRARCRDLCAGRVCRVRNPFD